MIKVRIKRIGMLLIAALLILIPAGSGAYAYDGSTLTDAEKNSSYGFFLWLSENAGTAEEKLDAQIAAQILSDTVGSAYSSKVFDTDGHFSASHSMNVTYGDLLSATALGAENDATSIECLRDAVSFIELGNQYRAKENLAPLKVSSAMMAMAELNVNIQKGSTLGHPLVFNSFENLAMVGYGGSSAAGVAASVNAYDPYEGWYTKEKDNYDENNGGQTGHYETLTDRYGTMLITGFGVRHMYDGYWHYKHFDQTFSTRSNMYDIGSGVTVTRYTEYLNEYICSELGHPWDDGKVSVEATHTKEGVMTYTCTLCGEKRTEPISKKAEHTPGDTVYQNRVDSTCSTTGHYDEVVYCTECGEEISRQTRNISRKEHIWGNWVVTRKASAEQDGEETRTCSVCGEKDIRIIDKITDKTDAGGKDTEETKAEASAKARASQKGSDGTALGKGASAEAAEAAISGMKNDNDLPGSVFRKIRLKSSKQTKSSISLKWTKVSGAKKYVIYGNKCGKSKMKKLATSTGKTRKITKVLGKKVKKGTYYKFMIVALDKNDNVVSSSRIIHVATGGGKVCNYKSVTVRKKVINKAKKLKKGKTLKLNAKAVKSSKKLKVKVHRGVRYESSNSKIASVTKKGGVVKGKKKGTCYIYAYAQNGVCKKIKVTVK